MVCLCVCLCLSTHNRLQLKKKRHTQIFSLLCLRMHSLTLLWILSAFIFSIDLLLLCTYVGYILSQMEILFCFPSLKLSLSVCVLSASNYHTSFHIYNYSFHHRIKQNKMKQKYTSFVHSLFSSCVFFSPFVTSATNCFCTFLLATIAVIDVMCSHNHVNRIYHVSFSTLFSVSSTPSFQYCICRSLFTLFSLFCCHLCFTIYFCHSCQMI